MQPELKRHLSMCNSFSWILVYLSIADGSAGIIHGYVGHMVTLPCRYDAKYYGPLSVCWTRGEIPSRGCGVTIVQTDGERVTERASRKYQINGHLKLGDASLTINPAEEADSGLYGCRVDIPGWFNDQKTSVELIIEHATTTTQISESTASETMQTTAILTTTPAHIPEPTTAEHPNVKTTDTAATTTTQISESTASETMQTTAILTITPAHISEPTTAEHPNVKTTDTAATTTTYISESATSETMQTTAILTFVATTTTTAHISEPTIAAHPNVKTTAIADHPDIHTSQSTNPERKDMEEKKSQHSSYHLWALVPCALFALVAFPLTVCYTFTKMKSGTFSIQHQSNGKVKSSDSEPKSSVIAMETINSEEPRE